MFGSLIHPYGLRRRNVRGYAGAHKTMLLTAVAYNLKKRLKYRLERQQSLAMALPRPVLAATRCAWRRNRRPKAPTWAIAKSLPKSGTAKPGFYNSSHRLRKRDERNGQI